MHLTILSLARGYSVSDTLVYPRHGTTDCLCITSNSPKGVESGTSGKRSSFVIDTSSVGAGTLSITVDGPSKVDLACNEVENGYEVSYTPMAPGKYYVTVKYNGKNVAGSPFACYVDGENLTGDDAQMGSGKLVNNLAPYRVVS